MKKTVALLIAVLFVSVIAATAFATDTSFEGEYRVRALAEWNFDKKPGYGPPDYEPSYDGWFEQRFRLTITHTRSEYLKAVIRLDLVEDTWGQGRAFMINNDPRANFAGPGSYIDWAYLEFTLPPIGTFTVGKFPEKLGYGLLFSVEAPGMDGIRLSNSWGPVDLSLGYAKLVDNVTPGLAGPGSVWYNRDTNLWYADLKYNITEDHMIELFGGYVASNDGSILVNSASLLWWDWFNWQSQWWDVNLGFLGMAYSGNIADMIDIKFEYSWVLGNAVTKPWLSAGWGPAVPYDLERSVEGYNLYLDVSYYNDLFRIGLAFIMGSGQGHVWTGGNFAPGALNFSTYHNINMNYLTFIHQGDFKWGNIIGSGGGDINSIRVGDFWALNNIENITSVKLYFEICPMEKLTLNAAVIWAKWTNPVGAGAFTDWQKCPGYPHPMDWNANVGGIRNYRYQSWSVSDDLGWEIDFGLSYEIMEGLTYTFSAGVLLTGESFDYVYFAPGPRGGVVGTRESWGPIWSISNELLYEF